MKFGKKSEPSKSTGRQPIIGVIATYFQMLLALACLVLFFFPFFSFLDSESNAFASVSQLHLLLGGIILPEQEVKTINLQGSLNFIVGIIAPICMMVVLYFRNPIRRVFAYFLHALVSLGFLVHIFTTKSVASSIVRLNADAQNYQVEWAWFAIALITFVGFVISVLLILSELSRLKDKQKQFEENEFSDEDEDDEYEDEEEEVTEFRRTPPEEKEEKPVPAVVDSSDEDINQSVANAIGTDDGDYYDDDDEEQDDEDEKKMTESDSEAEEEKDGDDEQDNNDEEVAQTAEKTPIKVKVKPVSAVQAHEDVKTESASKGRRIKPVNGVRGMNEDFDEHSGY